MPNKRKMKENFFQGGQAYIELFKKSDIVLFLDFDGTLAAIVGHYKSATILKESKLLLKKLVGKPECTLAVVSGRALSDVEKRVGLKNIIYAGNHGLEVVGPGITYNTFVKANVRKIFRAIKGELTNNVGRIKGVHIEDKSLTLSVHYRLVKSKNVADFKKRLLEYLLPYVIDRKAVVTEGKMVFEIKPRIEWNKGSVVLWLLKRLKKNVGRKNILPIFIGDDVTDEAAFHALEGKGLCIRVGYNEASAAPYYLKDIKQVTSFLKTILDSKVMFKEE
jgi:trehalose 6-phosphate phosphatase